MSKVHFGTMVPQIKRTWDQANEAAQFFESAGFESLWVNDHLYGPTSPSIPILEAWTQISALAAVTKNVEFIIHFDGANLVKTENIKKKKTTKYPKMPKV